MVLVEHHTKYVEIHGVDETVWMESGEHQKLHRKLRKEGKCRIPVATLKRISNKARGRTPKARIEHLKYKDIDKYKRYKYNYNRTQNSKKSKARYNKENIFKIEFNETIGENIILCEYYRINKTTQNITSSFHFKSNNGYKLYYIGIE